MGIKLRRRTERTYDCEYYAASRCQAQQRAPLREN